MAIADAIAASGAGLANLFTRHPFRAHAFQNDAAERRSFSGGDDKISLPAGCVNPPHECFAFLGSQGLQDFAPTNSDQEKEAPAGNMEGLQDLVDARHVGGSFGRGQGVDLDGDCEFLRPLESLHGAVKGAGNTSYGVVMFSGRAVEGKTETFDTMLLEANQNFAGQGGRSGGGDGGADAEAAGFIDQVVEVGPGERVAAGKDELGIGLAETRDLAKEVQALLVVKFRRVGHGDSFRTAVATGQSAGLGHFPVDVHGRPGEIAGDRVGMGYCTHGSIPSCTFRAAVHWSAMTSELEILAAQAEHAGVVLEMIRGLAEYEKLEHAMAATEEQLRETLFGERPGAEVLLARLGEEWVGFALFFPNYSTFLAKPGIFLEDLFVKPEARGKGVGGALLREIARRAVARGCGRVEWSVLDWNEPSIGFYKKLGAVPMDEWTVFRLTGDALTAMGSH